MTAAWGNPVGLDPQARTVADRARGEDRRHRGEWLLEGRNARTAQAWARGLVRPRSSRSTGNITAMKDKDFVVDPHRKRQK